MAPATHTAPPRLHQLIGRMKRGFLAGTAGRVLFGVGVANSRNTVVNDQRQADHAASGARAVWCAELCWQDHLHFRGEMGRVSICLQVKTVTKW